ncbi:MAG: FAD-binding oxidoreductase [Symploca sp. SIO2E9]|nr:FAD-binding oxidoreductase [Symploca sp. SIO2E9]
MLTLPHSNPKLPSGVCIYRLSGITISLRSLSMRVAVIGCGIIGAAIAYELSLVTGLKITVIDQQPPAQGATGAALGVLMGAISKKVKGRAWQLRKTSLQRYQTLIPELEALTGHQIPSNRNGILKLFFPGEDLASWEKLVETRYSQGWHLEIWDAAKIRPHCPQLSTDKIIGAIYSPQDGQIEPTALTKTLVAAAALNGVTFNFGYAVEGVLSRFSDNLNLHTCHHIYTDVGKLEVDWLVVAAGVGSSQLITLLQAQLTKVIDEPSATSAMPSYNQEQNNTGALIGNKPTEAMQFSTTPPLMIKPVLGQALQLRLEHPIGYGDFQPVITGDDVLIVPVGKGEYWIGATVEFPNNVGDVVAEPILLEKVRQQALSFCPALAGAKVIRTWSGKRPRPQGHSAPIITQLPGYSNVLVATGHYRNGVLLAPATAQAIREIITAAKC